MRPVSSGSHPPPRAAALVATGILLSRLAGLVRLRVFAHYFGLQSDAADAFNAAFRIPNFLQNLFGEGALSASFIPVYAGLLAQGRPSEADRVARAVFTLLALVTSALVLLGVVWAHALVEVIAPGFSGEKRALTATLVRILFPGAGLLVMSAWCLGVLNSHRRFFLSYAAPVVWNAAMIATLLVYGPRAAGLDRLSVILALGSVLGSALQFGVQAPVVVAILRRARGAPADVGLHVRTIARNFAPVFLSRGAVQVSAFIDALLASLLPTGAMTGLANAQLLYSLPVSLFGMSVSAAELPEMAGATAVAAATRHAALRERLAPGLRRIAFFVVPSAVALLAFGDLVAAALLQTGRFRPEDAAFVWAILAGSSPGLLATTLARLYSASYFALGDTRTPLRFALVRVVLATALGYLLAIELPPRLGIGPEWGAAGLTMAGSLAGWCEFSLLRRALRRHIGETGVGAARLTRLWAAAVAAAAAAWLLREPTAALHPIPRALVVVGPFGLIYLAAAAALRVPVPALGRR